MKMMPQRAVRAGWRLLRPCRHWLLPRHIRLPQPLQVRIGIHTGSGRRRRDREQREARTAGLGRDAQHRGAGAGGSGTQYRGDQRDHLSAGRGACSSSQDLGPQTLKGISTPLTLYRVVSESDAQSRFEAAVRTGLTPLVGREKNWDCCGGTGSG